MTDQEFITKANDLLQGMKHGVTCSFCTEPDSNDKGRPVVDSRVKPQYMIWSYRDRYFDWAWFYVGITHIKIITTNGKHYYIPVHSQCHSEMADILFTATLNLY